MQMSIIEINGREILEKRKNLTQAKAERVIKSLMSESENLYLCFESQEVREWGLPIIYASI